MDEEIFYRPHVEPTRDYHSDAVILHKNVSNEPAQEEEKSLTELEKAYDRNVEAIEQLLRIRQITPLLPDKVVERINDIIDILVVDGVESNEKYIKPQITLESEKYEETKKQIEKLKEKRYKIPTYGPTTEEEATDDEISTSTKSSDIEQSTSDYSSDDYEWPEMTSSGFEFQPEENKNIWDMASDQYELDMSYIREAFANEYNQIMENYVYQLLTAMDEIGLDTPEVLNFEYEGETVTGIKEEDQHLSDTIAKNQRILREMSSLFENTHDLYTTKTVMTAFDVISQERVRYLKERYNEAAASDYLSMYDKNLLAAMRDQYEQKYVKARSDLFRFLKSAIANSNSMLGLALSSNLAKCSLLKKDIDIFAKKEIQNEVFENTTTTNASSMQTGSSGSNKATDTTKQTEKQSTNTSTDKNTDQKAKDDTKSAASGSTKTGTNAKNTTSASAIDLIKKTLNKAKGT